MKLKLAALIFCSLAVSACTMHKVSDKQQLCNQAKRQQVFNSTNPSMSVQSLNNAKIDKSVQDNCQA